MIDNWSIAVHAYRILERYFNVFRVLKRSAWNEF